jgi:hypothetical protein
MSFTSESILKTFKDMEVADAPKLKHTQYLHYLAQCLGYLDYAHFKRCVQTAPSDRIGDFYTGLMQKICAIRLPREDIEHVRLNHFDGKSVGYDSYFIGWDKRGHEVREPDTGHGKLAIMDFREVFEEPLYVIETEAEFLSWQWKWGSFAAVPVSMARAHFPSLFNKRKQVIDKLPLDKIKRRIHRELQGKGLI